MGDVGYELRATAAKGDDHHDLATSNHRVSNTPRPAAWVHVRESSDEFPARNRSL